MVAVAVASALLVAVGAANASAPDDSTATGGADLEGLTLRIAQTSQGPDELPLWPTIDALEARGASVEVQQYAEVEDATRAMQHQRVLTEQLRETANALERSASSLGDVVSRFGGSAGGA